MKRKRWNVNRKPRSLPVAVANEPDLNIGYQNVEYTGLDGIYNDEFNSRVDTETLEADSDTNGRQVVLEKRVANEKRLENNVNPLSMANLVASSNISKRYGRNRTDSSMALGSSTTHKAALSQGGKTCQESILPYHNSEFKEEELKAALLVIKIIMKLDVAQPFNVPVNPIALGIPDYFDVIDTPMDFGTICKNLENGVKYMNSEDVFKDVKLIWENCSKYNKKGAYILELMKRVKSNFMKFWAAAELYLEQPQTINGNLHLQPPTHSNTKHDKCKQGCSVGQDNGPAPQLQDQIGPIQVQPHCHSPIYSKRRQPQLSCNQTDHSLQQHFTSSNQPQPSLQKHMENYESYTGSRKHGQGCPLGQHNGNPSNQLQDQRDLSQVKSRQISSIYTQKHQPQLSCNQGEHSLQLQQFDSSSNDSQSSQPEANNGTAFALCQDSTSKRRKGRGRGPSRCFNLLDKGGKRIHVSTNELGEPVGPEAPKLSSFLGTIARDGLMAPLIYADWRAMPDENKEKMWRQVELKFEVDPICKSWALNSLGKRWKDWKSKLKSAHYYTHATDEERLADCDKRVLPDQWSALVSYWSSAEGEKRSATNKANRSHQKFNHATGSKSFARVREEQRAKRTDGKEPSQAELFILTRTRKDGKPINQASSAVISQLRERATEQQGTLDNKQIPQDDIFYEVIGQHRNGRARTCGFGLSLSNGGSMPTRAEAMRMFTKANEEVSEMKERMITMEQTCAQMVAQMSTMMVMMSSLQSSHDKNQSNFVMDVYEEVPQQQVRASTSNKPVSPQKQVHASKSSHLTSPREVMDASEEVPQQQIHDSTSNKPVSPQKQVHASKSGRLASPRDTRASSRRKMQSASTTIKGA